MKACNLLTVVLIFLMFGCSSAPRYGERTGPTKKTTKKPAPSKKYSKIQTGWASFYAEDFHGKLTANGETYDMYGLTAAHKTLPLNTIVRVTNLENKKTIILRINDRGPFVKNRILDCSYGAAVKLGFASKGTTRVRIDVIELGDDVYMKHKEKQDKR